MTPSSSANVGTCSCWPKILVDLLLYCRNPRQLLVLFLDRGLSATRPWYTEIFLLQSFLVARGLCDQFLVLVHLQAQLANFGGLGRGFLILRTGRRCIGGVVHLVQFFLDLCDVRLGLDDIGMIVGVACFQVDQYSLQLRKAAAAGSAGCWPIPNSSMPTIAGPAAIPCKLYPVVRGLGIACWPRAANSAPSGSLSYCPRRREAAPCTAS